MMPELIHLLFATILITGIGVLIWMLLHEKKPDIALNRSQAIQDIDSEVAMLRGIPGNEGRIIDLLEERKWPNDSGENK